ncbi:MAG TPA: helix-turn-helix domain-containing protein [Vicinamibacteria bacterium]|nr:helix-turn-helix domain-containing protein [Vicinamibacteria bacterium]
MKRSNLAAALRTEVRRLNRNQIAGALRPLLKVQKQVTALRRDFHAHRVLLARLERRLARLRAARRTGVSLAPGRRGRPLSGQSIRRLRDRLRMTREQFARALQVSPGSIFGWESGRTLPRPGSLGRFEELRKMGVRQARAKFKSARPTRRARRKTKAGAAKSRRRATPKASQS